MCNNAHMTKADREMLRSIAVLAPKGVGLARNDESRIADEEWRRFVKK